MPQYKLTYFNLMALGEPIRLLLVLMKKEFEDIRIKLDDDWFLKTKQEMPFGKLPVLEIDGVKIPQSKAICRYLGREAGLDGKSNWDNLQIDIAIDTFHDMRNELLPFVMERLKQVDKTSSKRNDLLTTVVPFYMKKFDDMIKANGGHIIKDTLTWGDIYLASVFETVAKLFKIDLSEKYPNCTYLMENVQNIPEIRKWIEKRPETEF